MTVFHGIGLIGVLLGPVAQLLLKMGIRDTAPGAAWYRSHLHPLTLTGYALMLVSAFLYFLALRFVPLVDFVFILPFAYIFAPLLARIVLREVISRRQWIAIGVVMVGVAVFNLPF